MSANPRKFADATRLIVNVEREIVQAIDELMETSRNHGLHTHRNRAEFVRIAIEHELERCRGW